MKRGQDRITRIERSLNFLLFTSQTVDKVCSKSCGGRPLQAKWRQHRRYDGRAVDALAQAVDEGRGKLR